MAQNLFFIALLYTPVPLSRASSSPRDPLWTPHPAVYIVPVILTFFIVSFAPAIATIPLAPQLLDTLYYLIPQALALAAKVNMTRIDILQLRSWPLWVIQR